jgi:hypothetical protein
MAVEVQHSDSKLRTFAKVPKLLLSSQLQTFVTEKLPLVPDSVINDKLSYNQCRRALLITSIIAHAYIWQQSALASGETLLEFVANFEAFVLRFIRIRPRDHEFASQKLGLLSLRKWDFLQSLRIRV